MKRGNYFDKKGLFSFLGILVIAAAVSGGVQIYQSGSLYISLNASKIFDDIQKLYASVISYEGTEEKGLTKTTIFEYDSEQPSVEKSRELNTNVFPRLSSESFLVADVETGEIFAQKNEDFKFPIASLSKLMTAVVANDTISSDKIIPISKDAISTYGTQGNLRAGERMNLRQILYPLLLDSSNDAAVAIAEFVGKDYFVTLMNKKAKTLQMENTSFVEPSGLSPQNISTAEDLFKLVKYIENKKRFLFDITTEKKVSFLSEDTLLEHNFQNIHQFASFKRFIGGKNGYTDEAEKTLISLFKVPISGKESTISTIILKSNNSVNDTGKLIKWLTEATN